MADAPPMTGVILHDVPWDDYEAMLRIVGNRAVRINYDLEFAYQTSSKLAIAS
jgi:hypothetical protein